MGDGRILLNGFKADAVAHTTAGLWRHPASQAHRYRDLRFWVETAQTLERGLFDSLFVADALGVLDVYRGSVDQTLREGLQTPTDDPLLVVSAMAAATRHLGFGITVSSTYELPYLFARKMATLDHLTEGRIGWNVVTSALDSAARNLGLDRQLGHDQRYDVADEFMDVAYQLWEGSWEDDAVVHDRAAGTYADPAKVHPVDHHGRFFDVPGIFLCEPSVQRTPVIYQAGTSSRGLAFAARHAEGVFISTQRPDVARPLVERIRAEAAALGRDPAGIKVFAIMTVVTAPTDAAARAKYEDYRSFASIEGNLTRLSGITQVDMGRLDLDEPLEYVDAPGIQGILANFTTADPTRTWTPREVAEHMSVSSFGPVVVGSPVTVADEMERWVAEGGVDGFNLADVLPPATFGDLVDLVVPELRRRGRTWDAYEGTTLRESLLGPGRRRVRPDHPAAAHRRPLAPFTTPRSLAHRLGQPGLVVVDVRWSLDDPAAGAEAYRRAHLPGAVRLEWLADLSDPDDPVTGQLAPPERLADRLARAGIGVGSTVVAYDDGGAYVAARLVWALAHHGHADAQVLDGGWAAWLAAGLPTTAEVPDPAPAPPLELAPGHLRATKADVLAALDDGTPLVDCRMPATWAAAGAHIPGAAHLPSPSLFDPATGAVRPPAELAALAAGAGLAPDRPAIAYCGAGVSAAAVAVALRTAGFTGVRVYDGSWAEWGDDPDTPKEPH